MKARAGKKRSHEPYSSYGEAPVQNAQHKVDDGARPLRILFIDNIANNAYLNAKALRRHGVEVDVYVGGYYHIMACPEWEEGGFTNFAGTHNQPDWTRTVGLNYVRPDWVIQMREPFGLRYLLAKTEGRRWAARFWWKVGNLDREIDCSDGGVGKRLRSGLVGGYKLVRKGAAAARKLYRLGRLCLRVGYRLITEGRLRSGRKPTIPAAVDALPIAIEPMPSVPIDPDMPNALRDIEATAPAYRESVRTLMSRYDIVQVYGAGGRLPLIAGTPFLAFEHGTLRSLPFESSYMGQLTYLTYTRARHAFITNADVLGSAQRLELPSYSFIPHPVNEDSLHETPESQALRASLCRELDTDFIVFHPSRQHWEPEVRSPNWEKGNDIFIRGFARFVKDVNPRASAVMVDWGLSVPASRALLEELGVADRVRWIPPVPNALMCRYIAATDLLADQFWLGSFGSTAPKAWGCGKPAMFYLNEDQHRWCFPELPPVLNVRSPEDVFESLRRLHQDPVYMRAVSQDSKRWYQAYHSNELITQKLLDVYRGQAQT